MGNTFQRAAPVDVAANPENEEGPSEGQSEQLKKVIECYILQCLVRRNFQIFTLFIFCA